MIEQTILTKLDEILARLDDHTKLDEILARLDGRDALRHKRELKRAQQARYRANKRGIVVDTTNGVDTTKEKEEGKEKNPPDPLKEKGGEVKRNNDNNNKTRARAVVLRDRRIAMVQGEIDAIGSDIDAEYFVDYYAAKWPRDWQARLRNWHKIDKPYGRIVATAANESKAPRTFTAEQWSTSLCAERCANCRDGKCQRGITVPPEFELNSRPPEDCPYFKSL